MTSKSNAAVSELEFSFKAIDARISLSRQVADQLEAFILDGKIPVGEKLPTEMELCDKFGVSRTVIREAVAKLKSLGLLETKRGVGTTVVRNAPADTPFNKSINPTEVEDILNILELRLIVEEAASRLAAERRDDADIERLERVCEDFHQALTEHKQARTEDFEFHLAIAAATKNPMIKAFFEQFNKNVIPRAKLLKADIDQEESERYLERVEGEHRAILDAIKARDSEAAGRAMHQHLSRAYHLYEAYKLD